MTHNIGFQTVEYSVIGNKNIPWTKLCDVPMGFEMTDLDDYKFVRQVENLHNLHTSKVKIRLV